MSETATERAVLKRYANRSAPLERVRRASTQVDYELLYHSHHTDEVWAATLASVSDLEDQARSFLPLLSKPELRVPGLRRLLEHLQEFPGETWQDRWVAAGHEADYKRWESIEGGRQTTTSGLHMLLALGVVRPSYGWLSSNQFRTWYQMVSLRDPEGYQRLESSFEVFDKSQNDNRLAVVVLAHIVCRTGKKVSDITGNDLLAYRYARLELRETGTRIKTSCCRS